MITVSVIQVVCLAIVCINCGITVFCAQDSVKKWKEANKALKMANMMLETAKLVRDLSTENPDLLTSEEN